MTVAGRTAGSTWARAVTAVLVAVAVMAPAVSVAVWAVVETRDSIASVEARRQGAQYLRPLTRLLSVLVSAQSGAVRGEPADATSIDAALAAVASVERTHGGSLDTSSRWITLRDAVKELTLRPGDAGLQAFQRWSQVVDLTVELTRRIGDTSGLVLDTAFDSYYLMDAGLLRLPDIMRNAGQLSDLHTINQARAGTLPELRADVVRDRVAATSAAVNTGLGKVLDATGTARISRALVSPLDQFGAATDALAPTVAVGTVPPLPQNVPAAAIGVLESAERLAQTILVELDALLDDRRDTLLLRRVLLFVALGAAVLAGLVVAVLVTRRRREPAGPDPTARPTAAHPSGPRPLDPAVAAFSGPPRAGSGVR